MRTPPGGGWQPPAPEELQRGFPQYEIHGILGRGGMGAVYKGWQKSLDRFVAIKILPPGIEDYAVHYAERFKMEAKSMARLSHPGIVAVFDAGETAEGLLYFVMEFVEGTDVQKMIAQGPLPPGHALAITAHVCDALGFAHESGIVHRDIKPANIMVDARGHVKVADFGLAKVTTQDSGGFTGTNFSMGTPNYIAPEATTSVAHVDGRADLYAVGVMLYAMLTGEIPRGRFALASTKVPGIDPRFDAIVDKAMQADREQRYASAAALRTDLDSILSGPIPAALPVAPRRRGNPVLIAAAVAVVAIAAGAYFAWKKLAEWPAAKWSAQSSVRTDAAAASDPTAQGTVRTTSDRIAALAANPANWVDQLKWQKWEGAWVLEKGVLKTTDKAKAESRTLATLQDGAIRVRARATHSTAIQLRLNLRNGPVPGMENATGSYQLQTNLGGNVCSVVYFERHNGIVQPGEVLWRNTPLPAALAGQTEMEWELRVVGDEFSAWASGQFVASARHTRVPKGGASLVSDVGQEITKVETIDFASAASSPSLPVSPSSTSAATKDASFVNSLGMKFVPVPITGGPTDGQRVLFSVWETRVQDYEVFVLQTKREWGKPAFLRDVSHPAINVSWDDAQAFCVWLTERERKAGRLGASERYRLPADHEWSCAVGIGEREDPAKIPAERSRGMADVFLWGTAWPPPPGAGNYSGEEVAGHEWTKEQGVMAGYRDDFPQTAPVGSFAVNELGLFDLSGNAQEWCEDWLDREQQRRVLRGGSFVNIARVGLLSFAHGGGEATARVHYFGFRVVLAADMPVER